MLLRGKQVAGDLMFLIVPAGHFRTDPGWNQSWPPRPQEGFISRKEMSRTLSKGLLTSDERVRATYTDDHSVYLRLQFIKPLHCGRSSRIDFLLQRILHFSFTVLTPSRRVCNFDRLPGTEKMSVFAG